MAIRKTIKPFRKVSGQRLPLSSRLNLFNILFETRNNVYFNNIFRNFDITSEVKENNVYFLIYIAEEEDWWDNISHKYYGTERLWWLVCLINDVVNPFEEIEPGQQIKVLKEVHLYNVFKVLQEIAEL